MIEERVKEKIAEEAKLTSTCVPSQKLRGYNRRTVPRWVSSLCPPLEGFLGKTGDKKAIGTESEDSGYRSNYSIKAWQVYGDT